MASVGCIPDHAGIYHTLLVQISDNAGQEYVTGCAIYLSVYGIWFDENRRTSKEILLRDHRSDVSLECSGGLQQLSL